MYPKRLHRNVHNSFIYNRQSLEMAHISVYERLNFLMAYSSIEYCSEIKRIYNHMDEFHGWMNFKNIMLNKRALCKGVHIL